MMRVLVAHNFYRQAGGEDEVFHAEIELLRQRGHEVSTFEMRNDDVKGMSKAGLIAATMWNRKAAAALGERVVKERSQIVHFHNTFPLISPASYYAARRAGAAVVQSLHNYRLVCPGALLLRNGVACTTCVGKTFALPGVLHRCYRGSLGTSAATAAMTALHRVVGTWKTAVDQYIALTDSGREHFVHGGLPADRIAVKPHFVDPDVGVRAGAGGYALFIGRLSPEKGIETLIDAWEGSTQPLRIVGDGPLAPKVQALVERNKNVRWLGRRPASEISTLAGDAGLVIVPSLCYETFGRVAVEAFAVGTPVLGSAHGAILDVIGTDGSVGDLFTPGNAADLRQKADSLLTSPDRLRAMRPRARTVFEANYRADANYDMLLAIYERALSVRWPAKKSPEAVRASLTILDDAEPSAKAAR